MWRANFLAWNVRFRIFCRRLAGYPLNVDDLSGRIRNNALRGRNGQAAVIRHRSFG